MRNFAVASYAIATPHELLFDVKPSVSHLRVFGSVCTAYLPKPVRESKFSPVAVPGIFLGYSGPAFLVLTENGKIGVYSKVDCYELRKPKAGWVFDDPFATLSEEYLSSSLITEHGDIGVAVTEPDPVLEADPQQQATSKDCSGGQEEQQALGPSNGIEPTS